MGGELSETRNHHGRVPHGGPQRVQRMWQATTGHRTASRHVLQRLPRMETPAPRTEKEAKEMKNNHPIARFVGTIIGHLILAAVTITAITIPLLLILAVLTFWKTLIGVVI